MRNISGPVELTFHADGSVTQVADGPNFTVLEDDVERGGLPVGAVVTYGRVVSRFEEGTPGGPLLGFSVVSVSGRYESICPTLDEDSVPGGAVHGRPRLGTRGPGGGRIADAG